MSKKPNKQHLLAFRIPATEKGYELVEQMRKTLNKDSYKMRTLFTGKRPKNHTAYTLKKDAESIRVYIESIIEGNVSSQVEKQIYENGVTTGRAREQFANEELISELKKEVDSLQIKLAKRESHYNAIYNSKVKEWNRTLSAKENELRLEITGHNRMREERDALKEEVDRLNTIVRLQKEQLEEIEHSDHCESIDTCNCTCTMCEQVEGTLIKEKEQMREEIIALNKSLANSYGQVSDLDKEFKDLQKRNYCLLGNNNILQVELDTLRECHSKLEENADVQSESVSRNSDDVDLARVIDMGFAKWVEQQPWHKRWIYRIGSIAWRDFAFMMLAFWTIPMIVLLLLRVEGVIN